jgi:hypothetical protein
MVIDSSTTPSLDDLEAGTAARALPVPCPSPGHEEFDMPRPAHLPVPGDWKSVITKIGDELARLDPSISRPIAN